MTGASHSSVKRYRELARNPHKNGLERELLLDGPHLLFEARKSGLPIESAAFEQDALADPSIRNARGTARRRRRGCVHRVAENARHDEPRADACRRRRHRASHGADAGRCARIPMRARRRRARCSGSGECRRHHAHGRSRRRHGVRRDCSDSGPLRLEGPARIDGKCAAIADRAGRHRRRALRLAKERHRDQRARATRRRPVVRCRLQKAFGARARQRRSWPVA